MTAAAECQRAVRAGRRWDCGSISRGDRGGEVEISRGSRRRCGWGRVGLGQISNLVHCQQGIVIRRRFAQIGRGAPRQRQIWWVRRDRWFRWCNNGAGGGYRQSLQHGGGFWSKLKPCSPRNAREGFGSGNFSDPVLEAITNSQDGSPVLNVDHPDLGRGAFLSGAGTIQVRFFKWHPGDHSPWGDPADPEGEGLRPAMQQDQQDQAGQQAEAQSHQNLRPRDRFQQMPPEPLRALHGGGSANAAAEGRGSNAHRVMLGQVA